MIKSVRCGECGAFHDVPGIDGGRPIAIAATAKPHWPVHDEYECACGLRLQIVLEPADVFSRRAENAAKLRAEMIATGMRCIGAVAAHDPRTGERPISTWLGPTKTAVLTNAPDRCLRFGLNVLVGADSEIVDLPAGLNPDDTKQFIATRSGISITIFIDAKPRWPGP